jgi:NitT/TauT family transport system substrate-binding protein
MRRVRILAVLGVIGMALGLSAPATPQAPQKVIFALNWFPVGDHAAYWVALDKGYYRSRGLDVDMQNSKGSGDSIGKVDTGRADVGLADSAVVIAAVARGAKVKVVGMVFDRTPLNVWSRREAPITKPKDLEGKSIGAPPGDGQRQMFPAFARLHGIDQGKVTWVNVEPAAKVPALAEKRVDAVADYTTGLPFYEKALGKGNALMLPWAEHGFDMYSISIIASDKMMKERAAVLRAFLEASYLGWRDVMSDPRSALEIFKKRVPEIDLSIIEPNMLMGMELMRTDRYARNGIGWMEEKKMCASVDLVNTYMGVPTKVDCKAVYTNEFLTRIDLPAPAR